MDKAKQKLLEQTHQTILKVGFEDNDYELVADLISTNFVGFGTALDEKIFGIKDLKALLKRQKEQSKGIDMNVALRTLHTHLSKNENTAVYIDEGVLSITTDEEPIEMILRLSLVLEYIEEKWLMVHFHSSKPEDVESEKDTWGIENWKEKAEALEKEVAERTADLVLKNRDLEIEAALERVRARSMAMHSSNELNQVVAVLFENLKELQIPVTAAGIQVYLEDSEDMLNYVCGENSDGLVISHYRMPYFDNAIINDFKDARDKKVGFFVGNYSKKIKDSFYTYLFENTDIKDVPEDIKQMIFDSPAYTISMAPVSNSLIAINDFQGNQLSENNVAIIKRFAKVFEQAYIRFRDLQKAEAQNKESQIQLALERVRAKTMAMQHSDELREVVLEMYEQLQQLDFDSQACNIIIIDQKTHDQNYWVSGFSQELYPESYHVPNLKHSYIQQQIKAWKKGKTYEVFKYEGIEKKKFDKIFFSKTDFKKSPKEAQEMMRSLESITLSTAFTKYGSLQVLGPAPLNESKASILLRFAKVFNQTYTRFLDLKKAEAQAREAQIEAALEKVRSRSMAMRNSQELKEVALELRKQMGLLGQKDLEVCAIHLYGNDKDSFESWSAMKATGSETEIVQTQAHFPKRGIRIVDEMVHHYTIGTKDYILVNEGEKIAGWFKVLKKHAPELHSSILDSIGKVPVKQLKANWAVADFSGGALVMVTYGEPDEVSRNLLRRSANVFEQAYVRFLDLQKAEAQAREAQIQLCLERVRAKSMAMQSSNELETIIQVVHDQFVDLGVTLDHAGFIIDYKLNDDMIIWLADEHKVTPQIRLSYFDSPHWNSFITAKEKGHKLFVNHLDFKTKNKFYKQIFKYVPELPEDAQSFYLKIPSLTIATSLIDTIGLYIENFSGVQYGEEDQKILLRFGEEFQQAYTRFLDLKKVEAQARESQIQLSLERVRAKSMAMQSSDALHEVIGVVFQQFDNLGIHPVNVFLSLFHREERTLTYRASGKSGKRTPTKQVVDIDSVEAWTDLYNKWINDSSDDIEVIFYPKELVPEIFKLLKETFAAMPKADRMTVEDFPEGGYSTLGYTPFGYLGYDHTRPPTEEEKDILKRICTEFGRVYQRFLDIKKAEAQAREAQIEAALEKVRSRSLAMHHSDEVGEVANILLKKLEELELNIDNEAVIMIHSQDGTRNSEMWLASPDIYDSATLFDTPYMGSKLEKALWDKIEESNVDYFTKQFSKKVKNEYFNLAFEHSEFKYLPEDRKQYVLDSETYSYFCALKKYTSIVIPCHTGKLLTIDQIEILKRFSRVLEQAYIRFQDLKKAEAQARESEIQLALERVRASSLAMQSSADLTEVLTVLFSQFNVLGIQPLFAHLTLFDEENNRFSVRMTGRQGQRILAEQYIDVDEVESWKESYIKWQNGQPGDIDCIYYPPEVLGQVLDVLKELNNALPKGSKLHVKDFPDGTYTIQANFEYGYIGFNDDKMATEEQQAIVKRFAKEFSSAYRRFLDIEKAEAQAREAQIETALERVRSASMAMHKTEDIEEIVRVLFNQLNNLNIAFKQAWITILNLDQDDFDTWFSPVEGVYDHPKHFKMPNTFFEEAIKTWKSGEPFSYLSLKSKAEVDAFSIACDAITESNYFSHVRNSLNYNQLEFVQARHQYGFISKSNTEVATKEEEEILQRFAIVFGQAYTRFLDIEKAEEQAREANIQLALERLRASTMAMKTRGDLLDVIEVFGSQLTSLGVNIDSLSVIHGVPKRDWDFWIYTPDSGIPPYRVYIPYRDTPYFTKSIKNIEEYERTGNPIHFKSFNKEEKDEFLTHFFNYAPPIPKEFKTLAFAHKQSHVIEAFLEEVTVSLHKYGLENFSEEAIKIFTRFSLEFKQTYTRFLDLKKAEEQARQAQIEVSLERVRSRAMAMHQTDELTDVLCVLFDQFDILGINPVLTHLTLFDEENETFSLRITTTAENRIVAEQYIDVNAIEAWKDSFENWKKSEPNAINCIDYEPEIIPMVFDLLSEVMTALPKGHRIYPKDFPDGLYTTQGHFKFGYIGFNHSRHSTEEEKDIVVRFAKEFGRTYQRFLDIEKAEVQAKEAQIEAALEKVRSRSLGMQQSNEMQQVANEVHQQLLNLGFDIDAMAMSGVIDNESDYDVWVGGEDYDQPLRIPYNNDTKVQRDYNKAIKERPEHFTKTYKGKTKDAYFEHLMATNAFNPKHKKMMLECSAFTTTLTFKKNSGMQIIRYNDNAFSDEDNSIVKRFGRVFEQAYIRFLDLEKAEAQTREAQIEAALEKVRSRSMGMQKSTELLEVITVVSQQLQTLGFRFSHASFINNSLKEHNSFWVAATGLPNPMRFIIPYKTMPVIDNLRKAQKNKDAFYTDVSSIKEHQQWFQHLLNHSGENVFPKEIIDYQMSKGLARSVSIHTNIMLALANTQSEPYSDYENKIIARFGQVFEQSYTRFLDLQRAESQTREAQIEMSLEKVRSRTMAMQTSSELPEAANTLFLEVQALGIPAWSAGYCIWQDNKHNANCNMSSEGEIQKGFILPSIGEGYDFYSPQEKGEHFYVKELGGEALVKHYEFMKQLPNMGEILKELIDAGLELPTFQIFHIVYFKFGYVMFITYEEVPKAHDIFKRFGQVFEQTYTRFLDLERAEAQAREAKIEMALEKVRSRTMAMQKSDELQDAAQVLFNEIRGLGIPSWSCGYNILSDDKKSAECWMSSEGALQKPFTLYYEKEKSFIEQYHFFKSKKNFLVQEQKGRDLVEAYKYMKTIPEIGEIIVDLEESGISLPTHQFNHLCKFNKGYLLFITYEPVPEAHELFVRFTKVFEQTYTRFLDLKQAEARARESQIQTALERVRSHSMGMQSTADFANVTTEMFNQLRSFGEDLFATGIVFCDKHEGHVEQWHSIPGAGMLSPMIVPIDLDYIHQYRYDQWKADNPLFSIEIPSNFIEQHFEAIFKLPSAQVTLKDLESRNAPMPAPPDWEIDYGASFKHGYILASSLKPIENMDILPRFAQVFEQAYIRFLDLQKAEAQARESQIEAALEKVRSRTLAMQKSDELADTSVIVFKQLLELGIEPNRLFIGIIKNNGDAIEAWATNEDGSKIEQHFKLYTSKNKSIKKMVAGWKQQKKSAIIDMQGKELKEYFHYLNKVMHIPFIDGLKQKKRVQSIAYFSGGLIGMAAPEEQPEETIKLLERFAAVFNLTYTRFNDLKIAEAQAEQAEQDLINLQKAKKNAEKALAELQNTQKQLIQSEKMASLGELTAGIAHEIQNPLNFVNNFSEVSKELLDEMLEEIENGDMDEVRAIMRDVIQNLDKINHHGKRADGIVKGMLQHSRASGDKKEATDINALADEYLRLAYHGLRAKDKSFNAQLVTDFDDGIVKVGIIPQDIGRVVLNLLTNAFYAVHEKAKENIQDFEPTVSVRTKKTQDSVILEVKDNGNGIPDSVKEKIFQPFFTTKPTGQGTGLGLSMSYDIIAKGHDGELQVESTENEGTTFRIILPLNKNNL